MEASLVGYMSGGTSFEHFQEVNFWSVSVVCMYHIEYKVYSLTNRNVGEEAFHVRGIEMTPPLGLFFSTCRNSTYN